MINKTLAYAFRVRRPRGHLEAAHDISELRSLLDAFNEAKKTALGDDRPDAGHRAGHGNARRGVREVEGVWGWAVTQDRLSSVCLGACQRFVQRGITRCVFVRPPPQMVSEPWPSV